MNAAGHLDGWRGASEGRYPQWSLTERATKPGGQRTAAFIAYFCHQALVKRIAGLLACLWLACPAWAHNPDTSYTRVKISPREIEFRFTFDVLTLGKIVELDPSRLRLITRLALRSHAPEFYDFLRRHVAMTFDSQPADFGVALPPVISDDRSIIPEADYQQVMVDLVFRKRIDALPREFALLYDIFDTLGQRHTNLAAVEQGAGNVTEYVLTQLEPDCTYDTTAHAPLAGLLFKFLKLGVQHIFLGYDHILFLLALVAVSRLGELIKIITAFTAAHTLTLALATLGVVTPPPRLIESGIALTIMYVALENLWLKSTGHRWRLTFLFGLIHGFGFANVLRELGLPTSGLLRCLLAFNVGVEIGQLAIVLALLPLTLWLARQSYGPRARVILSLVIFAFGLAWFVERAFGLRFMPI